MKAAKATETFICLKDLLLVYKVGIFQLQTIDTCKAF